MKKYLWIAIALVFGLAATAQTKKETTAEVGEVVETLYYGTAVPLDELMASETVHTVYLTDENGVTALHSFDTEQEARDAREANNPDRATSFCTCYSGTNYTGSSISFDGKDHNALRARGWNDKISSYSCYGGRYFIAYWDKNYGGATLSSSSAYQNPNLGNIGWSNKISSIRFSY